MRSEVPNEKELFDAEEVAKYLGVERVTVQRWCRSGHLRCMKIGRGWRIRRGALEDFLKRRENTASSDYPANSPEQTRSRRQLIK